MWNANGTLGGLAINDPFNSSDTQTCSYGYDDLARIASVGCGSAWDQTFAFDAFGNVSKTGSNGGTSFLPTYSNATNRYACLPGYACPPGAGVPPAYDANGNLTNDSYHSYTWDAEGLPRSMSPGPSSITYDALGRWVEQYYGGYTQEVYDPTGAKLELMYQNGQTLGEGRVTLPGGAKAKYTSALNSYWHPDWLGSSRLNSTPSRTVSDDVAFAPYGELYVQTGCQDVTFTGSSFIDHTCDLYDFPAREYHPTQGRWISPDPAGLAAVDLTNPQSLNRYAYVRNNPTTLADPLGLGSSEPCQSEFNCPPGPGCLPDIDPFCQPAPICDPVLGCGPFPLPPVGGGGGGGTVSGGSAGGGSTGASGPPAGGWPNGGDYGPIYPLSLGQLLGLPGLPGGLGGCDFGVCAGPAPNALVSDVRLAPPGSAAPFIIYVYVLEPLELPWGLQALQRAGSIAAPVASPWAPVAWYGASAAAAVFAPLAPPAGKATLTFAATNPIAWKCYTSFAFSLFSPLSPSLPDTNQEYPCGSAGQMVSTILWWSSRPNGH